MSGWIDVLGSDAIRESEGVGVNTPIGRIGVFRVQGQYFACDDTCPHGQANLSDGFVDDYDIECPLHQGRFDLRTGEAKCPPVVGRIRIYPAKTEGGRVLIDIGTKSGD